MNFRKLNECKLCVISQTITSQYKLKWTDPIIDNLGGNELNDGTHENSPKIVITTEKNVFFDKHQFTANFVDSVKNGIFSSEIRFNLSNNKQSI